MNNGLEWTVHYELAPKGLLGSQQKLQERMMLIHWLNVPIKACVIETLANANATSQTCSKGWHANEGSALTIAMEKVNAFRNDSY